MVDSPAAILISPEFRSPSSDRKFSGSASIPRTSGKVISTSTSPWGVNRMFGPRRSNKVVSSSRSSAWTCSDTDGWLRQSCSAAREMLPLGAAKQKARNCFSRFCL